MKQHLRAGDIRRQTGLSKASVARLAKNGQIPGAWRVDGVHYAFPDSPQLQSWIAVQKTKREMQASWRFRKNLRPNANDKGTGHLLLEPIQNDFLRWRSRSAEDGFPNWKNAKLHKVTNLLAPFVEAFFAAAGELQERGESNPAIRNLLPRV
jgi:hypothetical protein